MQYLLKTEIHFVKQKKKKILNKQKKNNDL